MFVGCGVRYRNWPAAGPYGKDPHRVLAQLPVRGNIGSEKNWINKKQARSPGKDLDSSMSLPRQIFKSFSQPNTNLWGERQSKTKRCQYQEQKIESRKNGITTCILFEKRRVERQTHFYFILGNLDFRNPCDPSTRSWHGFVDDPWLFGSGCLVELVCLGFFPCVIHFQNPIANYRFVGFWGCALATRPVSRNVGPMAKCTNGVSFADWNYSRVNSMYSWFYEKQCSKKYSVFLLILNP